MALYAFTCEAILSLSPYIVEIREHDDHQVADVLYLELGAPPARAQIALAIERSTSEGQWNLAGSIVGPKASASRSAVAPIAGSNRELHPRLTPLLDALWRLSQS